MPKKEIKWKSVETFENARNLLSEDRVAAISHEFNLNDAQSMELWSALVGALFPESGGKDYIETLQSQKKGLSELESALELMADACLKLEAANSRLKTLNVTPTAGGRDYSVALKSIVEEIQIARAKVGRFHIVLTRAKSEQAMFSLNVPPDARRRPNSRRTTVCFALVKFWLSMGNKKAGYSTNNKRDENALGSANEDANINGNKKKERTGPLIRFIGMVVDCVTDPPANLSHETIRSEIRAANGTIARVKEYEALLAELNLPSQGS